MIKNRNETSAAMDKALKNLEQAIFLAYFSILIVLL